MEAHRLMVWKDRPVGRVGSASGGKDGFELKTLSLFEKIRLNHRRATSNSLVLGLAPRSSRRNGTGLRQRQRRGLKPAWGNAPGYNSCQTMPAR
jgi:hypothetical protein